MRRILLALFLILFLCIPLTAQDDPDDWIIIIVPNRCPEALNENPCMEGDPIASTEVPNFPDVEQFEPEGYFIWQTFGDYEGGQPASITWSEIGYQMDITGKAGEWGFGFEAEMEDCQELTVEGDFFVKSKLAWGNNFGLRAVIWEPGGPMLELAQYSITEAGGTGGGRWRFYVDGSRQMYVRVTVIAGKPLAGEDSIIVWRRIAVNAIDEAICEQRGVVMYPPRQAVASVLVKIRKG
jgi:hypothetical protein